MSTPDTTSPGSTIAKFDPSESRFPVLFADQEGGDSELAELMADNFDGENFQVGDLTRLHVPAGGGRVWELPGETEDGDPLTTVAVSGVLVHRQQTRSFWFRKKGADGEDSPPDCSSPDSKTGIGVFGVDSNANPTGECAKCPMNSWGSARGEDGEPGKGKACKEQLQLWVLQEGNILPTQISLPPTSLKTWRQYMTALLQANRSVFGIVTRFALRVEKANGNTFSVVNPSAVRDLSPEERAGAKRFGRTIANAIEARVAEQAEAARLAANGDEADAARQQVEDLWRSDAATGAENAKSKKG